MSTFSFLYRILSREPSTLVWTHSIKGSCSFSYIINFLIFMLTYFLNKYHMHPCTHCNLLCQIYFSSKPKLMNQWGPSFRVIQTAGTKESFRDGHGKRERERKSAPSREDDISAGPMKCSTCHNLKSTDSQGHFCKVISPSKTLYDISRCHPGTPASRFRVTAWEELYSYSLIFSVLTKSQNCSHSSNLDHFCASALTTTKLSHMDAAQASKYPHAPEWFCANHFQTSSYNGSHFLGSVWSQWICRKSVLPRDLSQTYLHACLNQVWRVKSWKLLQTS